MAEEEIIYIVTNDKWMREPEGILDPDDREIFREASQNGQIKIKVVDIETAYKQMKSEDPKKFKNYQRNVEQRAGRALTFQELVELGKQGNATMEAFIKIAKPMTLGQAVQVRHWRIEGRLTWRALARAAWEEAWFRRVWGRPANQIMGMALAARAAQFFSEQYWKDPWN